MQLSPITSYHLRKLFRQHCDRLQPLKNPVGGALVPAIEGNTEVNLESAWQTICQRQSETSGVVQKLESLVSVHQALEKQGTMYAQDLVSVEQTIFNVLGFQMSDVSYNI